MYQALDDIIANIISNTNLHLIVTESFIRRRKLNISLVFITQPYFKVSKDVKDRMQCFMQNGYRYYWKV